MEAAAIPIGGALIKAAGSSGISKEAELGHIRERLGRYHGFIYGHSEQLDSTTRLDILQLASKVQALQTSLDRKGRRWWSKLLPPRMHMREIRAELDKLDTQLLHIHITAVRRKEEQERGNPYQNNQYNTILEQFGNQAKQFVDMMKRQQAEIDCLRDQVDAGIKSHNNLILETRDTNQRTRDLEFNVKESNRKAAESERKTTELLEKIHRTLRNGVIVISVLAVVAFFTFSS